MGGNGREPWAGARGLEEGDMGLQVLNARRHTTLALEKTSGTSGTSVVIYFLFS